MKEGEKWGAVVHPLLPFSSGILCEVIQQMFIKCLLHARLCAGGWGCSAQSPVPTLTQPAVWVMSKGDSECSFFVQMLYSGSDSVKFDSGADQPLSTHPSWSLRAAGIRSRPHRPFGCPPLCRFFKPQQ